jgi:hypothetical protein
MDRAVIASDGRPPARVVSVPEAVARHRSVLAFLDRPVDKREGARHPATIPCNLRDPITQ